MLSRSAMLSRSMMSSRSVLSRSPLNSFIRASPRYNHTGRIFSGQPFPFNKFWSYTIAGTIGSLAIASSYALKDPIDSESESTYVVTPTYTHESTKVTFPTSLDTHFGTLQLVATGVRAVTFIGLRVYTAGLYIDTRAVQGWKNGTIPFPPIDNTEDIVDHLYKHGFVSAVVVVPVRSTSLPHLRDGFTRNLQGRLKTLDLDENVAADAALDVLKLRPILTDGAFPKGHALQLIFEPKESSIIFSRRNASLAKEHVILGAFKSPLLAPQLLKCYLSNTAPVSPELKEGLVDFIGSLPH